MISSFIFKLAAELAETAMQQQMAEPADISPEIEQGLQPLNQGSVLSLLGNQRATATEPAAKIVTNTGRVSK